MTNPLTKAVLDLIDAEVDFRLVNYQVIHVSPEVIVKIGQRQAEAKQAFERALSIALETDDGK